MAPLSATVFVRIELAGLVDGMEEWIFRIHEEEELKKYLIRFGGLPEGADLIFNGKIIREGESPRKLKMRQNETVLIISEIDKIHLMISLVMTTLFSKSYHLH